MKTSGKISVGQLLIGLALAAGVALAGLFLRLPEDAYRGEIRKIDREARRVVIQQLDQKKSAGGLVVSSRLDAGVDIDALREGDRVRFTMSEKNKEWKVTRTEAQP